MSSASLHKEVCPKCGREQMVERYDSINDYHMELFSKIMDKSIFDYQCEACKEVIHAPHPLLFHRLGIKDIQIGYKVPPSSVRFPINNQFMAAVIKKSLENAGMDTKDVCENYEDEEAFVDRVKDILKQDKVYQLYVKEHQHEEK